MASNRKFNVPINLLSLASDPASADEGDIYYNTTDDRIRVYKNTTWVNLAYADDVGITSTDFITFDTTPESTIPETPGTMSWDIDMETVKLELGGVTLQVGQEHVVRVKNASGSVAIPGRTLVMFAGATGDTVAVTPAISNNISTYPSDYMVGITTEEIPADGFGFVTQFGFVNNVNTEDWSVGTLLYADPAVAGGLTSTKPTGKSWKMAMAAVTKQSASAGRILVRALPGIQITEIDDIYITSPADNEVLAYDTSSGTWINQTAAEAGLATSGHTHSLDDLSDVSTSGATTNDVLQFNGTSWSPASVSAGTTNSFTTIATTSGTSPVADSSTDTLTLSAGTGITITGDSATDSITIASTVTDTNTTYDLTSTGTTTASINLVPSSGDTDSVTITGSGATSVSHSAGAITISSTDTDTTYTASNGITLSGTDIRHVDTSTQASVNNSGNTFIQDITLDTYGHITAITSGSVSFTGYATTAGTLAQFGSTTSSQLAGVISDETGSGSLVFGTSPTISGGTHTAITSLSIRDTSAAFDVTIAGTSSTALTAARTLTLDMANAARTVSLQASKITFGGSQPSGASAGDIWIPNS